MIVNYVKSISKARYHHIVPIPMGQIHCIEEEAQNEVNGAKAPEYMQCNSTNPRGKETELCMNHNHITTLWH